MRRRCLAIVLVACTSVLVAASDGRSDGVVPISPNGRYVIGLPDGLNGPLTKGLLGAGVRGLAPLNTIDAVIIEASQPVIDIIAGWSEVSYVEPDARAAFHNYQTSDQTGEGKLRRGAPPLRKALTGKGVTIAVFDSGIDTNHPDLSGQVVEELTFEAVFPLRDVLTQEQRDEVIRTVPAPTKAATTHGLSVGGVIAGTGAAADGVDMRGVAPGSRLVDFNLCCAAGVATQLGRVEAWGTTIILAYDYLLRHRRDRHYPGGIRIASNQWGFYPVEPYPKKALTAILHETVVAGVPVVISAGNTGPEPNTVSEPQSFMPELITMGVSCPAIDGERELTADRACGLGDIAEYSSRGPAIDITAPGAGLWAPNYVSSDTYELPPPGDPAASAENRLWYGKFGGTSAAAPYASGVIALMLEANPKLTPARIQKILKRTARDFGEPGFDTTWGWGEINAYAAVRVGLKT